MSYPNERTCLTLAQLNNSLFSCDHGNNLGYTLENNNSHSHCNNNVPPTNVGFFINDKKIHKINENIAFLDKKRLYNKKAVKAKKKIALKRREEIARPKLHRDAFATTVF